MWRVLLIFVLKLESIVSGETFGYPNPEEKESCYWREEAQKQLYEKLNVHLNKRLAKNVIVFLADGMSVSTVTAARIFLGQSEGNSGESSSLRFEQYPYLGLSKTYCVDKQVGEPACTSTAFLSGVKTNYGTLGVTAEVPKGNCLLSLDPKYQVDTLLTWAQEAGKSTGIITGDRVTGPSPAANYAHSADKAWENDADMITLCDTWDRQHCKDIARQLVEDNPGKNIQVILGGGRYKLLPKSPPCEEGEGEREDGRNLVKEWLTHKRNGNCNAEYVTTRSELLEIDTENTDYLMGLFNSLGMTYHLDVKEHPERPSLEELTRVAIQILSKNQQGFYLFVENGRIEKAQLDNQAQRAFDEVLELNKAIKAAECLVNLEDTLIVVLADHSHSLTISGHPDRGNDILGVGGCSELDGLPYTTLSYASGPGAEVTCSGHRRDVSQDCFHDVTYKFPALVPEKSESMAGDDVPVYAHGPWAHLLSGCYQQNYIPWAIAYAAQIGPFSEDKSGA